MGGWGQSLMEKSTNLQWRLFLKPSLSQSVSQKVNNKVHLHSYEARPIDPIESDDLAGGEGQDEDGAAVVVDHLEHDLTPGSHIEETKSVPDYTADF